MEVFKEFGDKFMKMIDKISASPASIVSAVILIFAIASVYFLTLKILKQAEAKLLTWLFVAFMVIGAFALSFDGIENSAHYFMIIPVGFLLFVAVVYSAEIRRFVWTKTFQPKTHKMTRQNAYYNADTIKGYINEIIKSLQDMSKNDTGALIVLSNGNIPGEVTDSGSAVNATISSALIESLFFPNSPLHDGAVIINGLKIERAGCFLPLTQSQNIPKELGTRHRAALGISEATDLTVFVVSEETGIISIVKSGKLLRYADAEMLRKELNSYYADFLGGANNEKKR